MYEQELIPTDLLLIVDGSEQMAVAKAAGQPTRWEVVRESLVRFVSHDAVNPSSVGLGLYSTVETTRCDPDAFVTPTLGMSERAPFLEQLGPLLSERELVAEPLSEAVVPGMMRFASEWTAASPATSTQVLLVGGPTLLPCMGVEGVSDDSGVVFGALLLDADLGGDGCAPRGNFRGFDSGLGADALVDELLDLYRGLQPRPEYPCSFEVPSAPDDGSSLAYDLAWFAYQSRAQRLEFPLLGSVSECAASPNGGFYYEGEREDGTPRSIVLCPCSCEALLSSAPDSIELGFYCEVDI